jgi:hypothetical protein
MTSTDQARAAAIRTQQSAPLEWLARAGFVGYGVTHLLVAWLALRIAFGKPGAEGDQSGALRTLAGQPAGRFLVGAIGVGLAAMALWQALEAAVGHRALRGTERVLERVASAGRTIFYGYLAWLAFRVIAGAGGQPSTASRQQATSSTVMSEPAGRWGVGAAGVALAALGIGLAIYGLVRRFERNLETGRMGPTTRRTARWLGVAGYAAKGVAYGIAGGLLVVAAATFDASKARGLDAALRTLAAAPYGRVLLAVVAAGIAAFGVFCFLQARYRRV